MALPLAIAAMFQAGCGNAPAVERDPASEADLLHAAMDALTDVIVYDIFSPPQASRAYAYASIAAYEAARHGDPSYRSMAGQLNDLGPVPPPDPAAAIYPPLAGVQAFMTVGRALTFSQARMDSVRSVLQQRTRRLARLPDAVFEQSIAYGDAVAQHILDWSKTDRFIQRLGYAKYTVVAEPGRWVPTPPGYMDAVEPSWATLRPFVLDSSSQFRPKPPHPYDMTEGSPFYVQAKEVFETGIHLTDEQRQIAGFWDCNPYVIHVRGHAMYATKKISPGGHWIGIVGIAARKHGADLVQTSAAYARTAIALSDAFISSWDEKFRSNLVRPETVINVHLDEEWQPLLQTPPFPEYTSGHSVISTAAAVVLTDQFGAGFAFADSSEMDYGLPIREFSSFEEAAAEAAISRLYGGIHYRMAIEAGIAQGRRVGDLVVQRVRTRADAAIAARAGAGSADASDAPAGH